MSFLELDYFRDCRKTFLEHVRDHEQGSKIFNTTTDDTTSSNVHLYQIEIGCPSQRSTWDNKKISRYYNTIRVIVYDDVEEEDTISTTANTSSTTITSITTTKPVTPVKKFVDVGENPISATLKLCPSKMKCNCEKLKKWIGRSHDDAVRSCLYGQGPVRFQRRGLMAYDPRRTSSHPFILSRFAISYVNFMLEKKKESSVHQVAIEEVPMQQIMQSENCCRKSLYLFTARFVDCPLLYYNY